jgi:hypothetical protein
MEQNRSNDRMNRRTESATEKTNRKLNEYRMTKTKQQASAVLVEL